MSQTWPGSPDALLPDIGDQPSVFVTLGCCRRAATKTGYTLRAFLMGWEARSERYTYLFFDRNKPPQLCLWWVRARATNSVAIEARECCCPPTWSAKPVLGQGFCPGPQQQQHGRRRNVMQHCRWQARDTTYMPCRLWVFVPQPRA